MLDFIFDIIKNTANMLAVTTLPFLILGLFMHYVTTFLRNRFSSGMGWKFFAYFTFVGTVIHELSHALMCVVFRHKIQRLVLFSPEPDGTLGYVSHSYNPNSFYQKLGCFFIGVAPLFCGIVCIYYLSIYLLPSEIAMQLSSTYNPFLIFDFIFSVEFYSNTKSIIWLYLVFSIFLHITLSSSDLEGCTTGLLGFIILVSAFNCYLQYNYSMQIDISNMTHSIVVLLVNQLAMVLILSLIILILYKIKKAIL